MINNSSMASMLDAISYSNKFHGKTFLIKLGGSILDDRKVIAALFDDLNLLKATGIKIIIVHGGSKAINKYLSINEVKSEFIDGLRVTSLKAMEIIEMVLCGHINKMLVRILNSMGINSVGLSGTDNNMLLCNPVSEKYGCVGAIKSVNVSYISSILFQNHFIPVVAPVGIDDHCNPMNINADYAAMDIAAALKVDKLIYITDQNGIYNKHGEIYSSLSSNDLLTLIKNKTVKDGMLIKAKAIISALNKNLLGQVHILNGKKSHVLIEELFTENGVGTLCTGNPSYSKHAEIAI